MADLSLFDLTGKTALVTGASGGIGKDEMMAAYEEARAALAGNAILFSSIAVVVMLVYFAIVYFSSGWFSRTSWDVTDRPPPGAEYAVILAG